MNPQKFPNLLVVLTALLALMLPLSGWAQFTYTTNNGAVTITGYSGSGGQVTIPSATNGYPVTAITANAFLFKYNMTGVTIPESVISIGTGAFEYCMSLHQAFFKGNAPSVDGGAGSADSTVFDSDGTGQAYYVPGTTGWGATFGGWPTAQWYQPQPQILGFGNGLGAGSQGFQFTISWATNTSVVVEASTNLQDWTPVSTNTLVNGTSAFVDSTWTNYPKRFYRLRSE